MSATSSSVGKGRARSCTGCRQVKLACDARRTAPQPCTRCKSKGLQCKFDGNFKRIPMRRVAQEITNELHKLVPTPSVTVGNASSPSSRSAATTESPFKRDSISAEPIENARRFSSLQPFITLHQDRQDWLQIIESDYFVAYQLGGVEVDAETAATLLKHFERYYLPHAPFLVKVESMYALATKSPSLFWTMILIASRDHEKHKGLYEFISVAHGTLLSQITQIAIQSMGEVHALLLLCLWPIPRRREKNDPAWSYIGLATNAAISFNCHRPIPVGTIASSWENMTPQSAPEFRADVLAATWIYCFQIGARVAASQGYPPPLSSDSQLRSVTNAISSLSSSLTEEQKIATEILRLSCLSTSEVDNVEDHQTRFAMIQMFDTQFNAVNKSNNDAWTLELDIDLLASKLYLYGILFTTSEDRLEQKQRRSVNKQLLLLRAQETALRLISRMTQLSDTPVDDGFYPAGALSFYPKHYFTSLFIAASFLFRFLASYKSATQDDTLAAVSGLTEAHRVFQSFPEHRDTAKAAWHVELLAGIIRQHPTSQTLPLDQLMLTNRLGASVVFDVIFRTTHHRNRDPATGASPPVSDWTGMDNDPRAHLPLTPEQRASRSGTSSNQGTDEGQMQTQMLGAWAGWDDYMNDFEIGEQWNADVLAPMELAAQTHT